MCMWFGDLRGAQDSSWGSNRATWRVGSSFPDVYQTYAPCRSTGSSPLEGQGSPHALGHLTPNQHIGFSNFAFTEETQPGGTLYCGHNFCVNPKLLLKEVY